MSSRGSWELWKSHREILGVLGRKRQPAEGQKETNGNEHSRPSACQCLHCYSKKASCCTSIPINLITALHISPGWGEWKVGKDQLVMAVNGTQLRLVLGSLKSVHRVLCGLLISITLKTCPPTISTRE